MSAAKTQNNLPNELDDLCREFYVRVLSESALWGDNPGMAKRFRGALLQLLGYQVNSHGVLQPIGGQSTIRFGADPKPDFSLFDSDWELVRAALEAEDESLDATDYSADETSPSEPATGDEVGDVLQQEL